MKTLIVKTFILLFVVGIYYPFLYAQEGDTLFIQRNEKNTNSQNH
jgi:cellobiose-specific phosphotransferase system component IIC